LNPIGKTDEELKIESVKNFSNDMQLKFELHKHARAVIRREKLVHF
jgi:hypothetical protein